MGKSESGVMNNNSAADKIELSALLSATEAILKNEKFQITARLVFDNCAKMIGARAGYVALMSDDGQENELLFLEDGNMPCTVNPELPMPIRGLREQSYRTGEVVYDNDFMGSEWVKYMPKGHMPLRNVLFSPLNIEGKTVGIMGFACKDGDFNETDARIAGAFGNYAAIALQNSRNLEALIESNNTKERLFSIIAHDLKSPFNSLLGLSDILVEEVSVLDDEKIKAHSKEISKTLNNTYNYLSNLLEWSRIQTDQIKINKSVFELEPLCNEVLEILGMQADSKNINVQVDVEKGLKILADRNMIKIIMINLISNAIKFSHSGSEVIISCQQKSGESKICVKDSGVGMSKMNCENLFQLSKNTSTKGTNNETGTGLGLIICHELVKLQNGCIACESELGVGTSVCFKLLS